jgi:uncharacterized membrane protein YfcA
VDVSSVLDLDLLIAAAAAVVGGLMRGFAGFGSAMLMAPIFAILFGPAEMVAIICMIELPVGLQLLPGAVRQAEWRFVGPMSATAVVFMPIGVWLLVSLDPEVLKRGVAAIVLLFAFVLLSGWRYRGRKSLPIACSLAALSGAMMATVGIGGPPVLLYMLSGPDSAAANRANIIVYFAATGVFLLLIVMFAADVVGLTALWRALALTPPFMLATWLGARLFRASSEKLYRRIALVFLLGVGFYGLLR